MNSGQAFDQIAEAYDDAFTQTFIGKAQRKRVYSYLSQVLETTDIQQVLEVNCGTGIDACWLALQGKSVLATDYSPKMIKAAAQNKQALAKNIHPHLRFTVCSADQIKDLAPSGTIDLVFSNFGGLNCLSPDQLTRFIRQANDLLRPGGYLAVVIMGKFCWWESLYFAAKLSFRKVFRRLSSKAIPAQLDKATFVDTWYYSARDCLRPVKQLKVEKLRPVGFWLPPSYLEPFFQRHPRLINALNKLEEVFGNWTWPSYAADHYFLLLRKP